MAHRGVGAVTVFAILLEGLDIDAIEEPAQPSGDHTEGTQPSSSNAELDSILSSNLGHMVPDGKQENRVLEEFRIKCGY